MTTLNNKAQIVLDPIVLCSLFPFCFGSMLMHLMLADVSETKLDKLQHLRKAFDFLDMHLSRKTDRDLVQKVFAEDPNNMAILFMRYSRLAHLESLQNFIEPDGTLSNAYDCALNDEINELNESCSRVLGLEE